MARYQGRHRRGRHAAPPTVAQIRRGQAVRGGMAGMVVGSLAFATYAVAEPPTSAAGTASGDAAGAAGAAALPLPTTQADPGGLVDQARALEQVRSSRSTVRTFAVNVVQKQEAAVAARAKKLAEDKKKYAALVKDAQTNPKKYAQQMMGEFGWGAGQWSCLETLWTGESSWTWNADNPTSDAYGIPQSLPGSKMAEAGKDWATNPITQIRWGMRYVKDVYGTPCSALATWNSRYPHWY